jgi:membrane protein DedA with SNARE-associated domain
VLDNVVNGLGSAAEPWGYVLLFVLALLEASAFIGLLVPGETALLVAGVLASEGKLSLSVSIMCGVAGAIVGDSVGYEIGRRLGPRLRSSKAGQTVGEERWVRAHAFVRDRGPQAVFFGRWVGLLRALVPAIAGDARMPYRRFLLWNVLGALASSPLVILLGYAAGSSYRSAERKLHWVSYAVVAIAAVAIVVRIAVARRRHEPEHGDDVARGSQMTAPRQRQGSIRQSEETIVAVMFAVFSLCAGGLAVALLVWG